MWCKFGHEVVTFFSESSGTNPAYTTVRRAAGYSGNKYFLRTLATNITIQILQSYCAFRAHSHAEDPTVGDT